MSKNYDSEKILEALEKLIDHKQEDFKSQTFEEIYEDLNLTVIPSNRNYWLIRTESGKFFQDFIENNYVAIGWDEFSAKETFSNSKESDLKDKISHTYTNDKRPGYIYNQIKKFMFDIKKDDMILIPSENSTQIAFGVVTKEFFVRNSKTDTIYNPQKPECNFKKCIKVKWITQTQKDEFNSDLRLLMFSRNTISDINNYQSYINRFLYPIYVLDNNIHITFNVTSKENISAINLVSFLSSTTNLIKTYQEYLGFTPDISNLDIKINVQSPGPIEIIGQAFDYVKGNIGAMLIFSLALCFFLGGKGSIKTKDGTEASFESEGIPEKILKFIQEHNKQKNIEFDNKLKKDEAEFNRNMEILKISNPTKSENSVLNMPSSNIENILPETTNREDNSIKLETSKEEQQSTLDEL